MRWRGVRSGKDTGHYRTGVGWPHAKRIFPGREGIDWQAAALSAS